MIVSEYRAFTNCVFTSSIVYFHCVVPLITLYIVYVNNKSGFITLELYYFTFFSELINSLIAIHSFWRSILYLLLYLILNLINKSDFMRALLANFLCLFPWNNRYTHTIMSYFWELILIKVGILNAIWIDFVFFFVPESILN